MLALFSRRRGEVADVMGLTSILLRWGKGRVVFSMAQKQSVHVEEPAWEGLRVPLLGLPGRGLATPKRCLQKSHFSSHRR